MFDFECHSVFNKTNKDIKKPFLTESERIEILMMRGYGDRERSYTDGCLLFNQVHPDKNINNSTVSKTISLHRETDSVRDSLKSGRPRTVSGGDTALNVLLEIKENPRSSNSYIK